MSFSVLNDGVHDSWLSSVIEFLVDVEKMLSIIKVNIPENDADKSFRKEFFKTSLDVENLYRGVTGSILAKLLVTNFTQYLNFEPTFPMKKVNS